MNDPTGFSKLVPGFDFLQTLMKSAGAAMPGIGQWVAPTIDPDELAKRIDELRTVQFWLEQNARMLGATIQAMEVQKMTLSALRTMNVQMEDLRDSLKIPMPGMSPAPAPTPQPAPAPAPPAEPVAAASEPASPRPAPIDPMQWWGALARQFADIAANAMRDPKADAARAAASPGVAADAPQEAPQPSADAPAKPDTARPRTARAATARKAASSR